MGDGGLPNPQRQIPWMQTPLDEDPLNPDPMMWTLLEADPLWRQTPPGHVTCDACWEAKSPWTELLTDGSENITLPKTSFAGSNDFLHQSRCHLIL